MKTKHVIKASGAIQHPRGYPLVVQKIWNILLYNAFPNLSSQDFFTIKLADIFNFLGNTEKDYTRNISYIKSGLLELMQPVEFNFFNKDNSPGWAATSLLSSVEISRGGCRYSYSSLLKLKLNNPAIYARINLAVQNDLKLKYSLSLYELCFDYYKLGYTPWFDIIKFRIYLGLVNEYEEFKRLNQSIIKPAIKEITKKTDIALTTELKRKGRRVYSIKFHIAQNRVLLTDDLSISTDQRRHRQDNIKRLHRILKSDQA